MKIIKKALSDVLSVIGKGKIIPNPIKSIFVLEEEVEEGHLLHNTLTQEILLLSKDEYENMYSNEYLFENWFFVDPKVNETKRVDQLREILKLAEFTNSITGYTIFTTTDCNARCYYCFESKCVRKTMSDETANKLADFIIKNSKGNKCHLNWFGGEPLLNYHVINLITKRLRAANVEYVSSMISNGFLFGDEINSNLNDWNLKKVQITLDGTEEKYNRIKAYIDNSNKNPFEKVINNIASLCNMNIHVNIRLNLSMINYQDMKELAKYLNEKFSDTPNLSVYTAILFQEQDNEEHRKILLNEEKEINLLLSSNLRLNRDNIFEKFKLNYCQVDSGHSVTVLPDGKLGLCEHFTDTNFIGDIDSGIIELETLKELRQYEPKLPQCSKCFYYPLCIRLKICERKIKCDDAYIESKKNKILLNIKDIMNNEAK